MIWFTLAGLGAIFAWLWLLTRSLANIRRQLDEAESRLARRFYTLQGRTVEMDAIVRELDFERRRAKGEIRFSADMTVAEALAVHPRVREVFAAFGLSGSGCSGSGLPETGSVGNLCSTASLDPREVLAALARFTEDPDGPISAQPATAKLYQIQSRPAREA